MHSTKLIKVLSSLNRKEFKLLFKCIQSPLLNTNNNLSKLYHLFKLHHPIYSSPKLEKRIVFHEIFPKQPYSDVKMRKLMSEMMKIVERLLLHLELENAPKEAQQLLTTAYGKRNLYPLFKKKHSTAISPTQNQCQPTYF